MSFPSVYLIDYPLDLPNLPFCRTEINITSKEEDQTFGYSIFEDAYKYFQWQVENNLPYKEEQAFMDLDIRSAYAGFEIINTEYSENYKLLKAEFTAELKCAMTPDIKNAHYTFDEIADSLIKIPFIDATVELTKDSIQFTLSIDENSELMISTEIFGKTNAKEKVVTFSYFVNDEIIISDSIDIIDLVDAFTQHSHLLAN